MSATHRCGHRPPPSHDFPTLLAEIETAHAKCKRAKHDPNAVGALRRAIVTYLCTVWDGIAYLHDNPGRFDAQELREVERDFQRLVDGYHDLVDAVTEVEATARKDEIRQVIENYRRTCAVRPS